MRRFGAVALGAVATGRHVGQSSGILRLKSRCCCVVRAALAAEDRRRAAGDRLHGMSSIWAQARAAGSITGRRGRPRWIGHIRGCPQGRTARSGRSTGSGTCRRNGSRDGRGLTHRLRKLGEASAPYIHCAGFAEAHDELIEVLVIHGDAEAMLACYRGVEHASDVTKVDATLELQRRLVGLRLCGAGAGGSAIRDEAAEALASLLCDAEQRFLEEVDVELANDRVLSNVEQVVQDQTAKVLDRVALPVSYTMLQVIQNSACRVDGEQRSGRGAVGESLIFRSDGTCHDIVRVASLGEAHTCFWHWTETAICVDTFGIAA